MDIDVDEESKQARTMLTAISKAATLEEIGEFWDTHSLADYWDQTHEVEFQVRARKRTSNEKDRGK